MNIASGVLWFGKDELFGPYGEYWQSNEVGIKSAEYCHELTLQSANGNVGLHNIDPSAFR
ncbi:MAG: hypothetical protein GX903_06365 [Spirochaetales bacterium]|nr:hypothetical protein [Spirochaetales bacterium]